MRRRTGLLIGGVAGVVLLGMVVYVVAVLWICDKGWGVTRGSLEFRLCGLGDEFIASIPTEGAIGKPRYSWTNPEGNKLGHKRLQYETWRAPTEVRMALVEFLRRSRFSPTELESDKDYEWWADQHTWLGFQVKPPSNSQSTHIEVIHNTGLD
jgi:hypothetical protein